MEFKTFCKNSHTTYCEFKPEHELFHKFYEIINQQQEMILSISEVFLGDIGRLISNNFLEQDWIFGKNHADRLTRNMVREGLFRQRHSVGIGRQNGVQSALY